MIDIKISGSKIKKELSTLTVCILAAIVLNIYSISKHETSWSELLGQLHVVIFVALVIYILVFILRFIFWGITRLIKK